MNTAGLFTPTEAETKLKSLSVARLEEVADRLGLVIGGSGKDGKTTKADYTKALTAFFRMNPTHVLVRIDVPYHNGAIENCAQWKPGEERIVSLGAWAQVKADAGNSDEFQVLKKLVMIDADED